MYRMMRYPRTPVALAAAAFTLLLTACSSEQPWELKDISGLLPDLQFELTRAADGERITEDAYQDRVRVEWHLLRDKYRPCTSLRTK